MQTLQEQLQRAVDLLRAARRIVVLTGAGISTESGIPDFRSPGSKWLTDPPVSYSAFISSAEARRQYWESRREMTAQVLAARPNPAHLALVKLEQRRALLGLITQNFDGLHLDAGHDPARVIEIHGTSREAACTLCGARTSMSELQRLIDSGTADPQCVQCGGYMKSATILFGQQIPAGLLVRAKEWALNCDLFLVVGSSLQVAPAAHLPRLALRQQAPLLIINLMPTPLDSLATVAIHEQAGLILPRLIEALQ